MKWSKNSQIKKIKFLFAYEPEIKTLSSISEVNKKSLQYPFNYLSNSRLRDSKWPSCALFYLCNFQNMQKLPFLWLQKNDFFLQNNRTVFLLGKIHFFILYVEIWVKMISMKISESSFDFEVDFPKFNQFSAMEGSKESLGQISCLKSWSLIEILFWFNFDVFRNILL